jgi:hypothetical protein
MIRVEGPDGVTIEFPPDTPEATIKTVMASRYGGPGAQPPKANTDPKNPSYGATRQAIQGATFGLADEISSGILTPVEMVKAAITGEDSGKGFMDRASAAYTRLVEQDRKGMKDYESDSPVASVAANIAGGLTPGGALQKAGMTFIKPGASTSARIGQGAAEGAAYGAAYGVGNAEGGPTARLAGAAEGGAVGGLTGGALSGAIEGARAVGGPIINAVRARMDPEGYAARKVADRLSQSGLDAETAAARLAKAQEGGQNMALVDVGGEGARNLARTAANIPGKGQENAVRAVNLRQTSQGDRIKRVVRDLFTDTDSYIETKDAIKEGVKKAAKPFYDQAEKQPIEFTTGLQEIIDTPAGRAAMLDAKRMAENSREPFKQFFVQIGDDPTNVSITQVPDMRAWNWIKQALDAKIEANTIREPFRAPQMNNEARILNGLKQSLVKELDAQNPSYAQARKIWSSGMEADAAIEAGRAIFDTPAKQFAKTMQAMSPQQRELARLGVAESIRARIDKAGPTNNALLRFFSNREQYNAIKAAFPDKESFAAFRTAMFNEARMRKSYDAVKGNSTTARQMMDIMESRNPAEAGLTDAAFGAATGGGAGVVASLLSTAKSGLARMGGMTPQSAAKMVDMLFARDPAKVQQIVDTLQRVEQQGIAAGERGAVIRRLLSNALANTSSGAAVRP